MRKKVTKVPKPRLWLLTRTTGIEGQQEAIGFVVRASSWGAARCHACKEAGSEGGDIWMDTGATDCIPLPERGRAGIILRSGTTD